MITKRQRLILLYFITRALFIGIGVSNIIVDTKQDGWIAAIIGILMGTVIIMIHQTILKKKGDRSIKDLLKEMKGLGIFIKVMIIIFAFYFMFECILIVQTYTTSFFLTKTPLLAVSIPSLFLIYWICNKGLATIGRVAECILPLSLLFFVFSLFALVPMIKLDNFLPILEAKPMGIVIAALRIAFISAAPSFLLIQTKDDGKKMIPVYLLSVLTIIGVIICTVGVLGPTLSTVFRFPEYMVLKRVQLFNFIEKIENILSLGWVLDLFIMTALSGMLIKTLLPVKRNNIYFAGVFIILLYLTSSVFGKSFYLDLIVMHNNIWILISLFVITIGTIFIYLLIKNGKNRQLRNET